VTIVVNKSPVGSNETLDRITWGAAQLGIAQGVLDAVADDILDGLQTDEVVVLIAVWVDPAAHDETAVRRANRAATRAAIEDALRSHGREEVDALVDSRDVAANAYYTGD
jgi:5,6,7,8-tetrahydromethanopterin hydro-lyase